MAQNESDYLQPWEQSLEYIGFKVERRDADCVEGRFTVSEKSCQPFGVLHGGISALVAEAVASSGSVIAAANQRVAGIQLTINHLRAAPIGAEIFVSAKPELIGRRIHVWNVTFTRVDSSSPAAGKTIAISRVTLLAQISSEVLENVKGKPYPLGSKL